MIQTRAGLRAQRFVLFGVLLALLVTAGLWWLFSGAAEQHYVAFFTRAVGVYPGSDVRVLGVKVGEVDAVTPRGEQVEVDLSVDDGVRVAADTGVVVIAPSVVADRYVQFSKLAGKGPKLVNGSVIGVQRTATPVELDQLYTSLNTLTQALGPNGANANGALSDVLHTGAQTLDGNGQPFNDAVRNFAALARTLAGNSGDLFGTVDQLQKFTSMLATNDQQVADVNRKLAEVSDALSQNRGNLQAALQSLGSALADIQNFIRTNRSAIKSNVDKLAVTTQTLADQRASLAEALDNAPLAVSNVLGALDPATGRLQGRGDLLDYFSGLPLPVTGDTYTTQAGGR